MKRTTLLLFELLLASVLSLSAQYLQTPYLCDFEDTAEVALWQMNTGASASRLQNRWYVDGAEPLMGSRSLYISSDNGASPRYVNSNNTVVAWRLVKLPAGTYTLSFAYKVGSADTDGLYVCWADSSRSTPSTMLLPSGWVSSSAIMVDGATLIQGGAEWRVARVSITSTGVAKKLCFVWTNNASGSSAVSAIIDNVQIAAEACLPPDSITVEKISSLQSRISWRGTAAAYDLMWSAVGGEASQVSNIRGNSYTVPYMGERCNVMVRAVCDDDSRTLYTLVPDYAQFDPSTHCFDFTDLTAPYVTATYGSYSNPYANVGVIDNGPTQMTSRHTVITRQGTDPRTGDGLNMIPPGESRSVRLGNWNNGSEAESITYTYTVPDSSNLIMLLKYAFVFESPGHSEPPFGKFEVMNMNNQVLDPCLRADYRCDGTLASGWNHVTTGDVWWSNWMTDGFNLAPYAGQTIKIRFTSADCNASGHYAYSYFALSCTQAEITSLVREDSAMTSFTAPEGFNYQWFSASNRTREIGSGRTLSVPAGDTATYICRVTSRTDQNCAFELTARLAVGQPVADFSSRHAPRDCRNLIAFDNESYVTINGRVSSEHPERFDWRVTDEDNNIVADTTVTTFGTVTLQVPDSGGRYAVLLRAYASGNRDSVARTIAVPPIGPRQGTAVAGICPGTSYNFHGTVLTEPGTYTYLGTTAAGCDSTVTLTLSVSDTILTTITETVCDGAGYQFGDTLLTRSGLYRGTFTARGGCDSIVDLNLTVATAYESTVEASICQGERYYLNGHPLMMEGDYEFRGLTAEGCDSVIHLRLTVHQGHETELWDEACGLSYEFEGRTHDFVPSDSVRYFTLSELRQDIHGCDSIVIMHLTLYPEYHIDLDVTIKEGEVYRFNGIDLLYPGVFRFTGTSVHGCDSIVTLTLNVESGVDDAPLGRAEVVPNPVTAGAKAVVYGDYGDVTLVEIVDMNGRVIKAFVPHSMPVELPSIAEPGLYNVRLTNREGLRAVVRLIVAGN